MSHDSWLGPWRPHRARAPLSVQSRSPGPKYRLPGGIGSEQRDPCSRRAPAYSFGRKLGRPEEPRSPGPQYLVPTGFTSRGRDRAPAFTMGRLPRERRVSSTPGPAQYHPELANRATLPSSPACVFIPRGRPDKPQETPGPASYELPPVMGPRLVTKRSAPEYSMAGRRRSLFDPRERVGDGGPGEQTPGPSNYRTVDTDVYMARAPRCTMAGRSRPVPIAKTPGPCDYSPRQATKQGQSFGVRHSDSVIPMMDP